MTDRPVRRKKPAPASRFIATGAALGTGLILVGGMAAASANASEPASVQRVVVVAEPAQPSQIVIVMPNGAVTPVAGLEAAPLTAPPKPKPVAKAPAPKAPAPVAESGGS